MTECPEDRLRFLARHDVAVEDFGPRSLVLLCGALQLREINAVSRRMLALLDGERTVQDIAGETGMAAEVVRQALLEMERQGMVRRLAELEQERSETMSAATYLANPDVSFRREGDEGGILYDVESDSLEIVNPVAAEIWEFLSAPHTQAEIAAHLCEVCDGAARGPVEKDVAEFLGSLLKKGFVGVVKETA